MTYTEEQLLAMDLGELDRLAFGVADGEVIEIEPQKLVPEPIDLINAKHQYDQGGLGWARGVDLSDPINIEVDDEGVYRIQDGHHRWVAAMALDVNLRATVRVSGNPVRFILMNQSSSRRPQRKVLGARP